jgi:DNA-binding NarL/FixJ family response regulator
MTRVVLADDHHLVRAGLRALLETIEGVAVVAEAGDGAAALAAVREHGPDVLITDVNMSGMSGLELAEKVKAELPQTRVIMLSMYSSDEYVMRALKAGASAYLLKDSATAELALALDAAARGQTYLSPGASQRLVERATGKAGPAAPLERLTARQREILTLIAEGVHTKEIAHRLGLSPKTVEAHRGQIMERLAIRDVPGLVRFAIRAGLVSGDE